MPGRKRIGIILGIIIFLLGGLRLASFLRDHYLKKYQKETVDYKRKKDSGKNLDQFSFAVLGDTQSFQKGGGILDKIVENIFNKKVDLVFTIGDLVPNCNGGGSCAKNLNDWKKKMKPLLPITYEVMGNHDRTGGKSADACWRKAFDLPNNGPSGFSESVYSLDYGNAHFVALNSEKPKRHEICNSELDWLRNDLLRNTKPNIFVFFHEPAFPAGHKIGGSLDAEERQRDALWSILDQYKVTAVFSGHEHIFSRRLIDNSMFPGAKNSIYQFIVGNTDSPSYKNPQTDGAEYFYGSHHFVIVSVDGGKINVDLYNPEGKLLNSFSFENNN